MIFVPEQDRMEGASRNLYMLNFHLRKDFFYGTDDTTINTIVYEYLLSIYPCHCYT